MSASLTCAAFCYSRLTSLQNITLLYSVVPEIESLVAKVWTRGMGGPAPPDALGTAEARVRFENLMVDLLAELSTTRMITLVR